jgi:ABC-2 type transport system permease protein
MITPILYDFKRSFLRLSTLLFIVIFILGGIGLSYLAYGLFASQYSSIGTAAVIVHTGNNTIVRGLIYDLKGNIIDKATLTFYRQGKAVKTYSVNGDFKITDPELWVLKPSIVEVKTTLGDHNYTIQWYMLSKANLTSYGVFGDLHPSIIPTATPSGGEEHVSSLVHYERLVIISKRTGRSFVILLTLNVSSTGNPISNATVYYAFAPYNAFHVGRGGTPVITGLKYHRLGVMDDYVKLYNIKIDTSKDLMVMKYVHGNSSAYTIINYAVIMPVEALSAGIITGSQGLQLFAEFFPILFIYLAYVLLAKPKSTGALEFVLARPVTRWDIYLVRWLAGILTVIVAVGLFVLSLDAGLWGFIWRAQLDNAK